MLANGISFPFLLPLLFDGSFKIPKALELSIRSVAAGGL
jgi:hypothetical protein